MTTKSSIKINYSSTANLSGTASCSGVLFEIPTTEVIGGGTIEIRLWGPSFLELNGYALSRGTASMGAGINKTTAEADAEALLDFAESSVVQLDWAISSITSVQATSELLCVDKTGKVSSYAPAGATVTSEFKKKGHSCLSTAKGEDIYGTVKLLYKRTATYKSWDWRVPVAGQGQYWFFIHKAGVLANKFSIQLPDLTDGIPEPRNITIHVVARDGGASLDNAEVTIDGLAAGITDADGLLSIDGIMTGTHTLLIKRDGFVDTDLDDLWNDLLEVY